MIENLPHNLRLSSRKQDFLSKKLKLCVWFWAKIVVFRRFIQIFIHAEPIRLCAAAERRRSQQYRLHFPSEWLLITLQLILGYMAKDRWDTMSQEKKHRFLNDPWKTCLLLRRHLSQNLSSFLPWVAYHEDFFLFSRALAWRGWMTLWEVFPCNGICLEKFYLTNVTVSVLL